MVSQNKFVATESRFTGSTDATSTASSTSSVGLIEITLGFLFVFRLVVPGSPFRICDLAGFLLVMYASFRKPRVETKYSKRFLTISIILVVFLAAESFLNGTDFSNRIIRICMHIGLAWAIATGRVSLQKLLQGFCIGLGFSALSVILGFAPESSYVGTLTGFIMDKNVSGLFYAFFTVTVPIWVKNSSSRFWLMSLGLVAVVATLSRTSIFAVLIALVWMAIGRRAGFFAKTAYAVAGFYLYKYAFSTFAYIWLFAERAGSDDLRNRINDATAVKVGETPWYGQGLGTATVHVDIYTFQFHNSYSALLVEGGWILTFVFLFGGALLVFRPFKLPPFSAAQISVQGAGIVVLVCALQLGEVFITLPTFMLLGIALKLLGKEKTESP